MLRGRVRAGIEPRPTATHYTTAPLYIYRLPVLIEHRTVEDIYTAILLQASMVWHYDMLHYEQCIGVFCNVPPND